MKKALALLLSALLTLALCTSCSSGSENREDGKLQVVTTIFASYDFVRQIAGDTALDVTLLLPPGTEVHSFEPTAQDIIRVQSCDLFIYVGGENDVWVERILDSLPERVHTLKLLDCVSLYEEELGEGMQAAGEEEAEWDEHVWTAPKNAIAITEAISQQLCLLDTAEEAALQANTAAYVAQLQALDEKFADIVANGARKTLLFADRFPIRYFVEEYGLSYYAAFPGCSSDTEPSAATVAFLIDKIRDEQIPAVFHIELSSEKLADAICADTGAQKLLFHTCHNVSREEFEAGETYLSLMERNAEALRIALG